MAKLQKNQDQNSLNNQNSEQNQSPAPDQQLLLGKLAETAGLLESEKQQRQALEARLAALESKKSDEEDEDISIQNLINKLDGEDSKPVKNAKNKTTDIDSMTPRQLLEVMADVMDQAVGGQLSQLEEKISSKLQASQDGFLTKLGDTQKILGQVIGHLGVSEAKNKFPDWSEVAEDVQKEMKAVPGLPLEKAYMLVKADRAAKGIPSQFVESERPGRSLTRASMPDGIPSVRRRSSDVSDESQDEVRDDRTKVRSSGIGDFRKRLQDAIETTISKRR